jgi:sporulation protein YlmC with PRC-barrel domain
MTFGRMQVQPGMEVVATGGQPIGRVSDAHHANFRVVRPGREDVYVPYDAIRAMIGEQIVLGVHTNDVDAQGWSSSTADGPPTE